jgi:hypothetical protein
MSSIGGPNIIRDGLKVFYDFSNTKSYPESGMSIIDLSHNQNGTINTATYGVYGGIKSLYFDGTYGTSGYVESNSSVVSNSSFSVLAWCRTTDSNRSGGTQGRMVSSTYAYQGNGVSKDTGWILGTTWTGTNFNFSIYDGNGASATAIFSNNWYTPNLNNWIFVVGVFSAGTYVRSFQNGIRITNTNTTISFLSAQTSSLKWARRSAQSQSNWLGQIATCMYYDIALSDEEVLQIYNATKSRFGL